MKNKSTEHLYQRLLSGDESALVEVYEAYKSEFLNFFKTYDINLESILDIYQESIIVIYQKIIVENYELTSSSLKTYIFGIGKHKVYDYFKKRKSQTHLFETLIVDNEGYVKDEEPNLYELTLAKNIKLLSNSCQDLLKRFYYRGLSIKEIVEQTDYKDENTVKSYKSRCLKKLKELCKS